MYATPSLRLLARPFCAAALIALLGACGEDAGGVDTVINDDTGVGGGVDPDGPEVTITAPTDGAVFGRTDPVSVIATVTDASDEPADVALTWTSDRRTQPLSTGTQPLSNGAARLEAMGLEPGPHTITLTARDTAGNEASASVVVAVNAPPGRPQIAIGPTAPGAADNVTVTVTGAPDDATLAPGAALTYRYTWHSMPAGALLHSGQTLPADKTAAGDAIEARVVANDGFEDGQPATLAFTIGNGAPTCGQVAITPSAADTTRDLTCGCLSFADPDGDPDRSTCVFTDADGAVLQDDGSCTLPASATERGMAITCALTPSDGTSQGSAVTSPNAALVVDAPPTAPGVAITPASGTASTQLTCEVTTQSVDPDSDGVVYGVRWLIGQDVIAGATSSTTTGAALGARRGDAVTCEVNALAGGGESGWTAAIAPVVLDNAPPTLDNVLLASAPGFPPTETDTLTCDAASAADADDDALTFTYTWFSGGALIAGADDATLTGAAFDKGDAISCQVVACDPPGACTLAVTSKTTLAILNATPSIGAATVGDPGGDGVAEPGDALTCGYTGWSDPDGDPEDVVYAWYVTDAETGETTRIEGATGATWPVGASYGDGDLITCEVTPKNDDELGAPRVAPGGVLVRPPSAVAPSVTLSAPSGADGDLRCEIATAGQHIPAGATWRWRWSISGGAAFDGTQTLPADQVAHCDLARCWVDVAIDAETTVSSNAAEKLLPPGSDCDDGDSCTGAVCLAGGGCNPTPISGTSCDDGDPCTVDDLCQSGVCAAGAQICVEDRLSVAGPSVHAPTVARTAGGGYVAHWFGASGGQSYLRATDGDASRLDHEAKTAPAVNTSFPNAPIVRSDGTIGVLRLASAPAQIYVTCGGCWAEANVPVYLGRYDAGGGLIDETEVWGMAWAAHAPYPGWGNRNAGIGPARVQLLAFDDGSMGVVRSYANGPTKTGVQLRTVAANLTPGGAVTMVAPADMGAADRFDVDVPADGVDHILVAWVGADGRSVLVQRFGKDGSAEDAAPIPVADAGADVLAVRVAGFRNGRFVVLWQASGVDGAGQGVVGQRFDDAGVEVGAAFQATGAVLGDQTLGDVAALDNYDFVVAYRDASDVAPAIVAQRFNASAQPQAAPVAVNAASDVGAAGPAIARLDGDEWVVAWNDAAHVLWTRRFAADGQLAPRAAERRVADTTAGDQRDPAAAAEGGGNTLVAWASPVYIGMGTEIVARVVDGEGTALTGEIAVNDHIEDGQTAPAVAGGPDRFVVAWTSEGEDGSAEGVLARVFDGSGAAVTAPFIVPEITADYQRQPAVAMTGAGAFAVVWSGYRDDTASSEVLLRVYDQDGAPLTGEVRANNATANAQERPAVAAIPFQDAFVVTWQSRNQDGSGWGVYMRKIGADGAALSPELRVNTVTDGEQREPTVTVGQSDLTAICWASVVAGATDAICQLVKTSTMAVQGGPFTVHHALAGAQEEVTAAFLANGRLMVAWATESLDHAGFAVQVAHFDNLGARVGRRRLANRYWAGDQRAPWLVSRDDRVFVGFQSAGQDGDGLGVWFRALSLP